MTDGDWSARLIHGDCIAAMATLEPETIDAICTDPPYGLAFMGRSWDTYEPAKFQVWCQEWGAACLRALRPGGHLLAFGGTRTYHRLGVGLEDAGFEIRDCLEWIYGSGFPKSLDVAKQIDRAAGAEREVVGTRSDGAGNGSVVGLGSPRSMGTVYDETVPATDDAKRWDGWGTALKPAHEPIVLARKPLAGTVAETVLEHGTGALNVGGCRLDWACAGDERETKSKNRHADFGSGARKNQVYGTDVRPRGENGNYDASGRWPANVLLGHLPECQGAGPNHTDVLCAPGCPVAELNDASGQSVSQGVAQWVGHNQVYGWAESNPHGEAEPHHGTEIGKGDAGGAARFFYIAKPRKRERIGGTIRNLHPTVKPIELMRHLVRLVTPPGGIVLDPFLGSGTTGCAAILEGARFVGVERERESYETSLARISDYAFAHGRVAPTGESHEAP